MTIYEPSPYIRDANHRGNAENGSARSNPTNPPQLPTDDEIVSDWKRHDAFRFRSVLFPILLMLLFIIGQWTSSPWFEQIQIQRQTFSSWGSVLDISTNTWTCKITALGLAPLLTILLFDPIPSRAKMRFVIALTLLASLLQALSFLSAGATGFYVSIFASSFAFGLTVHTTVITLLGWFPDFSIFVFASIAIVAMLSHWINLALGTKIASAVSLPTLPIIQGLIFMIVVIPLHFFIQSPPLYIPLFIRSMLHAASLPQNVTLPLPTTLGIAARIPRALGKLQQWKKKLKSKGARRGYGELVNEEDIDQLEEVEMNVAQGFDLYEDDLDDIYGSSQQNNNSQRSQQGSRMNSTPNSSSNRSNWNETGCELQEIVVHQPQHDPNDILASAATATTPTPTPNTTLARKTGVNVAPPPSQFVRHGDEDDDGDADFALDENDFGIAQQQHQQQQLPQSQLQQQQQQQQQQQPLQNASVPQSDLNAIDADDEFASAYDDVIEFDPSSAPFQEYPTQDHIIDNNDRMATSTTANSQTRRRTRQQPRVNYRMQVGAALNAVVSQLDQYSPLSIPELLSSKPFQHFLLSAVLPLIFPFLLIYITPTIYFHIQNRSEDSARSIFNTAITVVSIFTFLLLLGAQFFGNKGVLTTSLIFIVFATITWSPFSLVGKQYDPLFKSPTYNPLHIIMVILYIGSMTYCFLIFPAVQKYFHDENVRVLSAIIIATLAATYMCSPLLLLMRDDLVDQATFSAASKIAVNCRAYNWISRIASICTFLGMFALYRTRPLAVGERRFKC